MAAIDFPNSPTVGDIFTAGNSSYRWTGEAWVANNLGSIEWDDVTGKPTEFTPETHAASHGFGGSDAITIEPSQVTGLNAFIGDVQAELPTKSDIGHTHVKTDITDFAHTHLLADITDYVEPDPLPSQTGNAGKYLTTNGSITSWGTVDLSTKLDIAQVVEDKSTNYTIVASDRGKILRSTGSSETIFTIADVLGVGESITFFQAGTGLLVFEPAAGVNLASFALRRKSLGRNSRITVTKTESGTYSLSGDLAEFILSAEYLVIAGGGGGGTGWNGGGGGGGAGGYRSSVIGESSGGGNTAEPYTVITLSTNYTVTVGAGGAVQANGSNSVFGTITSTGGGAGSPTGGAGGFPGAAGGSGGGGGAGQYSNNTGTGGAGTVNQGRAGGNSAQDGGSNWSGGGGGGANSVGSNAPSASAGGNGGAGVTSSITGAAIQRAGGGGGAGRFTQGVGSGGGGNGQILNSGTGQTAGAANTGGGGGGFSAAGGSGVVILRYPSMLNITIGAGLTGSTTTVGSSKVTTITAGTGNVSWVM